MRQLKGIKILLVDDEPHILEFLELGLTNEGFEVMTAQDGISAITACNKFQPHIAILGCDDARYGRLRGVPHDQEDGQCGRDYANGQR